MSEKRSIKIKSSHIGMLVALAFLMVVITVNSKFIVENVVRSNEVDEEAILEAVPRLNRQQLQSAVDLLNDIQSNNLTSNFPSDTLDKEATVPGEQRIISLNIQNASGINGAAAEFAQAAQQSGYEIQEVSTAPSLQKTTTVVYKKGLKAEAKAVEDLLISEGWPVGQNQETGQEQPYDIIIILGK